MTKALAVLLVCQLAGEIVSRGLGLPVPGPVLGLLVLFLGLHASRRRSGLAPEDIDRSDLGRTGNGLLQNLALLFVPAGAGVVQHLGLLAEHGGALLTALVASTALTLAVTVGVFAGVKRLLGPDDEEAS